jgi:hypothetical protein
LLCGAVLRATAADGQQRGAKIAGEIPSMLPLLSSPVAYFFFPLFLDAVPHHPEPSFDVL